MHVFTVCFSKYISDYFVIIIRIMTLLWSNVSIIFELVISDATFHIAVSFCKCMLIKLGRNDNWNMGK